MMVIFACANCQQVYPDIGFPSLCPHCGGLFDIQDVLPVAMPGDSRKPGIWEWGEALGVPAGAPIISLGEGNTPCVPADWNGKPVHLKLESQNPTGSYKDRGSATTVSWLASRHFTEAVEDSSGNAGASFAAYAARAGIHARVYVPASASGPKRTQIEMYSSELIPVPGPRSAAAEAVLEEAAQGVPYASHAFLPFGLPGIATIAYELVRDLGQVPGTVIAPLGHGGLMLGMLRGFEALLEAHIIPVLPALVGVQAAACAPYVIAGGSPKQDGLELDGQTVAEGVRVREPSRLEALQHALRAPAGDVIAIPEVEILPARAELARQGFYVEPTSALAWSALKYIHTWTEPVAVIITGSGYKNQN